MSMAAGIGVTRSKRRSDTDVVLGEDWVAPDDLIDGELRQNRERRSWVLLNSSPLARKIITFNLLAMVVLVAGVLYLNPFRNSLLLQRESGLVAEARLIANMFEAGLPADDEGALGLGTPSDVATILATLERAEGIEVQVFDASQTLLGSTLGLPSRSSTAVEGIGVDTRSTVITDFLNRGWEGMATLFSSAPEADTAPEGAQVEVQALLPTALAGNTRISTGRSATGETTFSVATPILQDGRVVGAVALTSVDGVIDDLGAGLNANACCRSS